MELRGKTILITGAGRGLGAAMARRLAARGANLALLDLDAGGMAAVRERHGEDGERYLRTLARYASEGWPGIAADV